MMHRGTLGICECCMDVRMQRANDGCEIFGEGDYARERWRNWQAGSCRMLLNLLPQRHSRFLNIGSGAGDISSDVVGHRVDDDEHVFFEGSLCLRDFWGEFRKARLRDELQVRDLHMQQGVKCRLPTFEIIANYELSSARWTKLKEDGVKLLFNGSKTVIDPIE